MRSTRIIAKLGLALALGGCALAVSNTEDLLTQAGFKKLPASSPKLAQHVQTIAPRKLIHRQAGGKSYYVYADPGGCNCVYVGSDSAYATYKSLVTSQEQAMALEEAREEESVEGAK